MNTGHSRSFRQSIAFLASLILFGGLAHCLIAAEGVRDRVEFERHDIPADRPDLWPKAIEKYINVPRASFLSLIEKIRSRDHSPRQVSLKSVHYEASLMGDSLRGGVLTASVKHLEASPSLLELGKFSFAIENLKWQNRPAIWGASSDGNAWVVTDGTTDELLGEWSCRGRTIPGGFDFDMNLPTATTSFLDLRVPSHLSIHAPGQEVVQLSENVSESSKLWRIHCGGNSRCRMTFLTRENLEKSRPVLTTEHDMHVTVREEEQRFQLTLYLEALDAPVDELVLKGPVGLEIFSAVYGGDTPVAVRKIPPAQDGSRFRVQLPGILKGRRRTLRVEGSLEQKPVQPTVVAQISVENSLFDGGILAVSVQPPLQERSAQVKGFRQRTSDGDTSTYQQLTPDAQLILDVRRSEVSLTGQLVSLLSAEENLWNLTSEIRWNSLAGSGYRTSSIFPPDWEISDVILQGATDRPATDGAVAEAPKMNWDVKRTPNGESILSVEFLDSIQSGQPRSIIVTAQRKAPALGQFAPVPLPQLVNCDASETWFGLEIPSSMTSEFTANSRLERVASPASSRLNKTTNRTNLERHWYRCDTSDGAGKIQIVPKLQPVDVTMETFVEALPAEYRVRYSINSLHQGAHVDRLLVYLTESSSDIRWVWKGNQPVELTAVRLPKSRHVDGNLPSSGELWEFRLPRAGEHGIAIEGTSINRWPENKRLALLYVPQALQKQSELKLVHPDSLSLQYDTSGMKPAEEPLSWIYSTPQAEFELSVHNPEPSQEFPTMVSMQLQTQMSADADGSDLYRARLRLENGSSQDTLVVRLDSSAIVQSVSVGGETIKLVLQNGEIVIPDLSAARRDIVEIIYRVPARAILLRERRPIVVPQVSARVLGFSWRFGIPSSSRLFSVPSGVAFLRQPESPSWNERFFGPLGRSKNDSIFSPWSVDSWRKVLSTEPTFDSIELSQEDSAVETLVWEAYAQLPPEELSIELWHAERTSLIAWITFGTCLLLGSIFRIYHWTSRARIAACALACTLAVSFFTTSPYVNILGGATGGILLAFLMPRSFLEWSIKGQQKSNGQWQAVGNSTFLFVIGLASTAIGATLYNGFAIAQLPPENVTSKKAYTVYVPVDKDGLPSDTMRWVYVSPNALEQWKTIANEIAREPDYLISSARYNVSEASDGNLDIIAKLQVHLLSPSTPITIVLPVAGISLLHSDSCRVNGKPHAVAIASDGKGYLIELTPAALSRPEFVGPSVVDEESKYRVESFDIEIHGRKPRIQATEFELSLPPVPSSLFEFEHPDSTPIVEITGAFGAMQRSADERTSIGELGATSEIRVRWGQSITPQVRPRMTVSMLQNLKLKAGYSEFSFAMNTVIDEGSLEAMEFDLPDDAVVQRIQSRKDELLYTEVFKTSDGRRRLRVILDRPNHTSLAIDGTMVLTRPDAFAQSPLPVFGLAKADYYSFQFTRNWWGVSTSSEFRLEPTNVDPEYVSTISPEAYLDAWNTASDPRHGESSITDQPQFAFELREGRSPSFSLSPLQARRKAIQWRQIGVIGRHKLDWTVEGEIESSHVPTFQTVLLADRRLRIDDVSIKENRAERLSRWTESREEPSRIVLFQNDRTQGVQKIRLRGSIAIAPGRPILLPTIRVDDCEMSDDRLVLMRDPEIDVAFEPPAEWNSIPSDGSVGETEPGTAFEVLGHFQIKDSKQTGSIRTESRHSRCASKAYATLTRAEGSTWRLKYRLEMTPEGESPVRMGVEFPPGFPDWNSVTVEGAEPVWHELRDRPRQLDLLLNRNEAKGTVVVRFDVTYDEPRSPEWELPLPVPLHAFGHETLVAVESGTNWSPKGGRDLRRSDLPDRLSDFYEGIDDGTCFALTGNSIPLQREIPAADFHQPVIRMLDQRIQVRSNGSRSGIAFAYLSSLNKNLILQLPSQSTVMSVFLDDNPLALDAISGDRLQIPVENVGGESVLTITWTDNHSSVSSVVTESILMPLDVPVERNLVTINADDPTDLVCLSGLTMTSSIIQSMDRLETLLDRQSILAADSHGAAANRWMIRQIDSRLRIALGDRISSEYVARWNQIEKRISQLESSVTQPPTSWSTLLIQGDESTIAVRGRAIQGKPIRLWKYDRRAINFGLSVLFALFLIPILRHMIRTDWSDWLVGHSAIAWSVLALFWWLFLTPSALGLVILVSTIAHATWKATLNRSTV